ncbi:hypothetical protein [Moraxella bovis]|uniref:hypothetical protein n=1 Tax=Moraxella bovis TaxID=476 RepID=UPI0015F1A0B4|nr:hypothetical protein [Moraxella bovis]
MRRWALIIAWAVTAGIIIATLLALAVVRPVLATTWAVAVAIMFTPAVLTFAMQKLWKNNNG